MANTTIPNLPSTVAVDGTEQLEAVQNGTSVRVTAAQIASLAQNTQGTVTLINTAGALTGGPITTTGTISLPPDAVTNAYLAEMPANTVKANLTGSTANPTDVTPSAILNTFGTAAGSMLYRDAGVWTALAPGSSGYYLTTTGAQPQWTALSVSPSDIQPSGVTPGTYGTASQVAQFTVAASGQITSAGNVAISIPAGQVTGLGTMATQNANNVTITGGTMNSVTIGATNPSQAYFTTISGGVWNGSTIGIPYGGTGATDAATARTNLGLGTMATQNASGVAITGGAMNGVTIGASNPQAGTFTTLQSTGNVSFGTVTAGTWNGSTIGIAYGGTGATTASGARLNLSAAASGANSDITSLSGLTTPLSAPQGGTGFASYTTGDLLYATSSSALGRLNDVVTGNVLRSGGVGVAPAWGKLDLTTDVTGALPASNGGTGATTLTGYVYGNGTGAMTASPTIPISALQYNGVTIGSTPITLGSIATTLSGLTSVTLTQDPTAALQAATKQYVDAEVATVSNQTFHTQVVASTTANLNATYSNGTGGVGATLTNAGAKAQFQTDNITPDPNARILVKNQTNAYENGIYVLSTVGSPDPGGTNWVLTRATDFDTVGAGPNRIQTGSAVFVDQGDTWGATGWVMNTTGVITVGVTNLDWAQTSAAGAIQVTSPLTKSGNIISLGTVPVNLGGTNITSYTVGDLLYANTTTSLAKLADVAVGNVLRSGGVGAAPAWGKVALSTDVSGTLPVANGGTGTATAFTQGSVLFAGASGVYSQNNANFYWDNVNTRLGIHTTSPDATLTILSETQTALPPGVLPSGTDLHLVGANSAETRITQDSFGTGNYPAYTGRHARGTAASPTATQSGDVLSQYTGRGFGATTYNSSSTGVFQFQAAENFTDTAQGTYASLRLTATGAASPTEVFRFGPAGQFGVGGSSYGTANQILTSNGTSAAPSWNSGISVTTLTASDAVTMSATTQNIAIGTSQTSGTLTLGGASQTAAVSLAPSTKSITIGVGSGATESAASKTLNLGTAGVSGSTTAINIGASAAGATSTTTLYGTVKVNGLTASKPVFTDASSNLTSSGTLLTDQGGTGLTSYTVGDLLYYSAGTALTKLGIGTNGQILTSNGTAPVWASGSSISVNTATNLAGGAAGSLPYQSGAGATTFLGIGAANRVLTSSGTAPQWVTALTGLTGVSSSSITNTSLTSGRVVYSTTGGAQTDSANLVFNGTSLGIGTATPTSVPNYTFATINGSTGAGITLLNGGSDAAWIYATSTGLALSTETASPIFFKINAATQATLDASGNFGIGTTTPGSIGVSGYTRLVLGAGSSSTDGLTIVPSGTGGVQFTDAANVKKGYLQWDSSTGALALGTAGITRATIDSSGNLGLGVTPSAWSGVGAALQVGLSAAIIGNSVNSSSFISNAYFDGTNYRYIGTGFAQRLALTSGAYSFQTAASGTAGNAITFTTGMTLDASGNLGIGTTSPSNTAGFSRQLQIEGTTAALTLSGTTGTGKYTLGVPGVNAIGLWDNTASAYRWYVDSSGNLGIGTTSPGSKLTVSGDIQILSTNYLSFSNTAQQTYIRAAASNTLAFGTSSAEVARFDSSGNFLIGTTLPYAKLKVALTSIGTLPTVVNVASFGAAGVVSLGGATNNNDGVYLGTGDTNGSGIASGIGFLRESSGWNSALAFYTNNVTAGANGVSAITERMRLNSSGNLGIGTTSPAGKLHVENSTPNSGVPTIYSNANYGNTGDTSTGIRVNLNNGAGGLYISGYSGEAILAYNNEFIAGSGWVARSTTASQIAQVSGDTIFYANTGLTAGNVFTRTERLRLTSSGDLQLGGTQGTIPALGRGMYVESTSGIVGYSLYVNNGVNNRRGSMFLDNTSGVWGWDVTASSGIPYYIWRVAGAEKMRLTDDGRLALAEGNAPTQILSLYRSGSTNAIMSAGNSNTGLDGTWFGVDTTGNGIVNVRGAFPLLFSTNATERARIDSSGNFGLGGTPSAWSGGGTARAIQIASYGAGLFSNAAGDTFSTLTHGSYFDGTNWKYLATSVGSGRYQISGANAGSVHSWSISAGGTAGNNITYTQAMTLDASGNLLVGATSSTGNGERLYVTNAQNVVGVIKGTSTGLAQLNVWNDANKGPLIGAYASTYGGGSNFSVGANGSYIATSSGAVFAIGTSDAQALLLGTSNTERARIDSLGNLLINTTDVDAGINGNVTKTQFSFRAASEGFRMSSTGSAYYNVGNAVATQYVYWKYAGTTVGSIAITSTATAYNTSSDRRLKDNIVPAPSASSVIDAIQVVSHDWKAGGHTRYGVIAQDLYEIAPEAVKVGDDGEEVKDIWGVDYSKLVPILVKAIQELKAELKALKGA